MLKIVIDQCHSANNWCIMVGGISNFQLLLFINSTMDVSQILQGLNYKVCPTMSSKLFAFGLLSLVFGDTAIIHQQLVAKLRRHLQLVYR